MGAGWVIRAVLGALGLVLGLGLGALSVSGVVSMQAARFLLLCAWPVGVTGVVVSVSSTSRRRYKIGVPVGGAIVLALGIWQTDAWIVRQKATATTPQILYYSDKELTWLNGSITLERGCSPVACMRMHVWPWPSPESFGIYGIWMKRPARVPPFGTNGYVYLEFSEVVAEKNTWCRPQGPEALHPGYKIGLICAGSPQPGGAAWIFPNFNFVPIPKTPLSVRVALEYGDIVSVPAEFTLLPPGD